MKKIARDIMTASPECARIGDSILDVAKTLARLDVGALPICGADDALEGMVTDRDIVVKVLAAGRDPSSTTDGYLAEPDVVSVGSGESIHHALQLMAMHQIRRLPVVDGGKLVGIISQADIARNWEEEDVGELVEAISKD